MAAMTTLFISDLHLDPERPAITELFGRFVEEEARGAEALRAVSDAGTPVSFMHGNRDFLLGHDFARRAGMAILTDPSVVCLYGRPTLLLHGDTLCTGDVAYQQFRAQTRNPTWQRQFLAQPLAARLAFAQQARAASKAHQSGLSSQGTMETITDVAPDEVAGVFARFGVDTMIHGHTHRPAMHQVDVTGRARRRIVLGDWYEQGSVLRVDAAGERLEALA